MKREREYIWGESTERLRDYGERDYKERESRKRERVWRERETARPRES